MNFNIYTNIYKKYFFKYQNRYNNNLLVIEKIFFFKVMFIRNISLSKKNGDQNLETLCPI